MLHQVERSAAYGTEYTRSPNEDALVCTHGSSIRDRRQMTPGSVIAAAAASRSDDLLHGTRPTTRCSVGRLRQYHEPRRNV